MEQFVLLVLALAGILISVYFTGVYYGLLKSNVWWMPAVCQMDEKSCQSIIQTPEARVFGVPNFVLGLVFYILVILTTIGNFEGFLFELVLAGALFTVILAVYLVYSLRVKLKTDCVLCYTAHVINTLIAIILSFIHYEII